MTPIVCCGETLEEREAGGAEAKVEGQIRAGLAGVTTEHVASLVIAYEPIWAIGTGRTATSEDAQAMCAHIRRVVGARVRSRRRRCGAHPVRRVGQARQHRRADGQPDIDGALVGGASLDADEFAAIVQYRNH